MYEVIVLSVKSLTINVDGMVCTSCERAIDKGLRKLNGVLKVKTNYKKSETYIEYDTSKCAYKDIISTITKLGYSVNEGNSNNKKYEILTIAGIILIALVIIKFGQNSGNFDISEALSSKVGFAALFLIGLLTSLHCVGMCGGIMISQSITLDTGSKLQKLKPAILYNLGRLISYTILGGFVGGLGSVISLSTSVQASISIFAGIFMVFMGFNMSGFKAFKRFSIRLPWSNCKNKNKTPFTVGLINGIMPCGPLQTMQLYALASGSILLGATSMFFFALGTIPLMLLFGVVANFLNQKNSNKLIKISGIIVVVLGLIMANRGLSILGINLQPFSNTFSDITQSSSTDKGAAESSNSTSGNKGIISNGKQTVRISATSRGYTPKVVYLQKDIPTELIIEGERLTSCNREIIISSLNIRKKLSSGENVIEFTPTKDINYSCWMGMLRGSIKVVDDLGTIDNSNSTTQNDTADSYDSYDETEVTFYGLPITEIPTDRLIKRSILNGNTQSLTIKSTNLDFEPSIIVSKSNTPLTLNFTLSDKNEEDGTYYVVDSTFSKIITTFEIKNANASVNIPNLELGTYGIIKGNRLLTIIESTTNPVAINLEDIRKKYF